MVMFRDPLKRNTFLRIGERDQDIVVENALSQKRQFQDAERVKQLSQNAWNHSPYTRDDRYIDLMISNPKVVGRIERYRTKERPGKYHRRERI